MICIGDMIGVLAALIVNAAAIIFLLILWGMIFFILADGVWDSMDIGVIIGSLIGLAIGIKIFQEERARGAI